MHKWKPYATATLLACLSAPYADAAEAWHGDFPIPNAGLCVIKGLIKNQPSETFPAYAYRDSNKDGIVVFTPPGASVGNWDFYGACYSNDKELGCPDVDWHKCFGEGLDDWQEICRETHWSVDLPLCHGVRPMENLNKLV